MFKRTTKDVYFFESYRQILTLFLFNQNTHFKNFNVLVFINVLFTFYISC